MRVLLVVVLREGKPLFYEVGGCRQIKGGRRRRRHHRAEGHLFPALKIDRAFEAFRHFRVSADAPRYQRRTASRWESQTAPVDLRIRKGSTLIARCRRHFGGLSMPSVDRSVDGQHSSLKGKGGRDSRAWQLPPIRFRRERLEAGA